MEAKLAAATNRQAVLALSALGSRTRQRAPITRARCSTQRRGSSEASFCGARGAGSMGSMRRQPPSRSRGGRRNSAGVLIVAPTPTEAVPGAGRRQMRGRL